jgi:hypothetical protein
VGIVDVTTLFRGILPLQFTVTEDPHFVFLFYKGKLVAIFPSTISEQKIKETALSFLRKQEFEDQDKF